MTVNSEQEIRHSSCVYVICTTTSTYCYILVVLNCVLHDLSKVKFKISKVRYVFFTEFYICHVISSHGKYTVISRVCALLPCTTMVASAAHCFVIESSQANDFFIFVRFENHSLFCFYFLQCVQLTAKLISHNSIV